jgi:DNA anti-recombination protein RmuC
MGFISGVVTGIAVAAAGAAWYMSRSGAQARDQLQLERRLGEVGDQLERRAREIQQQVNTQVAEIQRKNGEGATNGSNGFGAEAAEAAAKAEAEVEHIADDAAATVGDAG